MKRIVLALASIALTAGLALAQTEEPKKPGDSPHSDGRTVSPEVKGAEQPQGPTGPTNTTSGGAPPESPQGQTPPGMQAAPDGSKKTVVEPGEKADAPAKSAAPATQPSATPQPSAAGIFEKGVLTVAGVDPNNQAAPAKYSERTDAADRVPIAGYALGHLGRDQRSRIYQALHKSMGLSGGKAPAIEAAVGAEVSADVALHAMQPIPEDITRDIPEMRGLAFVRDDNAVLIVSPTMHRVLVVLAP